jgi:FKBP-type peptidyl-prolyl cis-trans isomerase FkpA
MKKIPAIISNSILSRMLLFGFSLLVLGACKKDTDDFDYEAQKALDRTRIQEYLTANNLTATSTESGLHYIIKDPGTGGEIKLGDVVSVHYHGYLLNGTTFEKSFSNGIPYTHRVGEAIPGFSEGLLKLKGGGKITLFIPSDLAYGRIDREQIPANSVLIFDLELVNGSTVQAIDNRIIQDYLSAKNITNAVRTDSGAFLISTSPGTGAQARINDEVAVHYRARFLDNQLFEQTNASATLNFRIGSGVMRKGFEDAVRYMSVGEKATILVPSYLNYGASGSTSPPPGVSRANVQIPPYAVLIYEVELVGINR